MTATELSVTSTTWRDPFTEIPWPQQLTDHVVDGPRLLGPARPEDERVRALRESVDRHGRADLPYWRDRLAGFKAG